MVIVLGKESSMNYFYAVRINISLAIFIQIGYFF